MEDKIFNILKRGKSIFLIGPTNFGKTWFLTKKLIPFLRGKGMSVVYWPNCERKSDTRNIDVVIVDEAETLQDKDYMASKHPADNPYYSKEYVAKVKKWFDNLRSVKTRCVYVISRNEADEIANIINSVKTADWDGREVQCLEFKRGTRS